MQGKSIFIVSLRNTSSNQPKTRATWAKLSSSCDIKSKSLKRLPFREKLQDRKPTFRPSERRFPKPLKLRFTCSERSLYLRPGVFRFHGKQPNFSAIKKMTPAMTNITIFGYKKRQQQNQPVIKWVLLWRGIVIRNWCYLLGPQRGGGGIVRIGACLFDWGVYFSSTQTGWLVG